MNIGKTVKVTTVVPLKREVEAPEPYERKPVEPRSIPAKVLEPV